MADLSDLFFGTDVAHSAEFDFDPFADVAVAPAGSWRWNSDKPALHQYLRDYFAARREDG